MSKKKTPPEKKKAAYENDHYTRAWSSPHSFPKAWKKKKNYVNRVVRRRSKALLDSVEGLSIGDLSPDQESFNENLFRRGLTKRKLLKTGVVTLREKVERKIDNRRKIVGFNVRKKQHAKESFRRFCVNILNDKNYSEGTLVHLRQLAGYGRFQAFLESEPHWIPKLEQWMFRASKRIAWGKKLQAHR